MARIQTPQHVQEVQAEFKIREQFGLELLETVQPTFSLGDQKVASTGYPRKCMGQAEITAGVGDHSECIITCPADIGIVMLVEEVWISNVAGETALRSDDGVAPATVTATFTTKAFRDGRIIDQKPDGILQAAEPLAAAPNGQFLGVVDNPSGETTRVPLDWILGGGSYFLVRNQTLNAILSVVYTWTEFLLEDR